MTYAELHLHTAYSFLEGGATVGELIATAADASYKALAVTDHDNLVGAMEFANACHDVGIQPVIGCEVTLTSGHHLTLLAETRKGYGNLCRLISYAHIANRRNPALDPGLFGKHAEGLILLTGCRTGELSSLVAEDRFSEARDAAKQYMEWFRAGNVFIEVQHHLVKGDTQRTRRLVSLARELGLGIAPTGNVHYHTRDRHRLQDCLVAIRGNVSLEECHQERRANSEFYLRTPKDMAFKWRDLPDAVANTFRIADRCAAFDLTRNLAYEFPSYPVPAGHTEDTYLEQLCVEAAQRRYGGLPANVRERLEKELRLIRKHKLAGFLLLYREIILMAQEVAVDLGLADSEVPVELNPPGRGRGSSVAMLVGYLIGLSHIDPLHYHLSLERFLPDDDLPNVPDIDLDFPRNIREELILRVHRRYGWERAALTGMIETYRVRGAVRDLGKALGLPVDQIDQLAKRVDDTSASELRVQMGELPEFRDKADAPPWSHMVDLAAQLDGFPRQLAQHPGGMVISSSSLTEIVPVQPSAIEGRYVMQWDKDSIDYAKFVKIDFLALGALSQIQEALTAIEQRHGKAVDLSRIDFEDSKVYDMIHKADTIGIFQIESAAQMQTVTRIRPMNLADMAHEVGAVRPGVGVNDGVRHYIQRRNGTAWEYDHTLEKRALERTHGVILFQDQVNQLAIDVGGLPPSEADRLRRAFGKRNNKDLLARWWERFQVGAAKNGVDEETAARIFAKFNGQYMFPESHAFAFGVTAYQASWLKAYYPLEFYLGLFNQQPMGFYTPETLKEDARRHGVTVLNPDVNRSAKVCVPEGEAIRLGLTYVTGIGPAAVDAILGARERGSFTDLADFMRRTGLEQAQVDGLVDAGAFDSLAADRRQARWQAGLLYQPLGRQTALPVPVEQDMAALPKAGEIEEMQREYATMGLYPSGHVMAKVRTQLPRDVIPSEALAYQKDGAVVTVAGLVIRRQRPLGQAVFVTLEDEFGHAPLIVWPNTYARLKAVFKEPFLVVTGVVSRREGTMNVVVTSARALRVMDDAPPSKDFR